MMLAVPVRAVTAPTPCQEVAEVVTEVAVVAVVMAGLTLIRVSPPASIVYYGDSNKASK